MSYVNCVLEWCADVAHLGLKGRSWGPFVSILVHFCAILLQFYDVLRTFSLLTVLYCRFSIVLVQFSAI